MAKTKISPTLLCGEENNISKKICIKKICFALVLLVAGSILFLLINVLDLQPNTAGFFACGCIGLLLIIWGVTKLCCDTKHLTYNNSTLSGHVIYLANGALRDAMHAIEAQDWSALQKLVTSVESGTKIELVVSADRQFARCQVLTYVPYQFEPVSDVLFLTPAGAEALLKLTK
ncbi:MAG: hypothetical protein ACI392_02200 [Paludibacteraceae bacterium]